MFFGLWVQLVLLSGIAIYATDIPTNSCNHRVTNNEMNTKNNTLISHCHNKLCNTYSKWRTLEWLVPQNKILKISNDIQDTNDIIMSNPYIAITFLTL